MNRSLGTLSSIPAGALPSLIGGNCLHLNPLPWLSQVWFDTPASLEQKYAIAAELGLRGVGMWNLDCLDYRCTDLACRGETEAMWAALRVFTGRQ